MSVASGDDIAKSEEAATAPMEVVDEIQQAVSADGDTEATPVKAKPALQTGPKGKVNSPSINNPTRRPLVKAASTPTKPAIRGARPSVAAVSRVTAASTNGASNPSEAKAPLTRRPGLASTLSKDKDPKDVAKPAGSHARNPSVTGAGRPTLASKSSATTSNATASGRSVPSRPLEPRKVLPSARTTSSATSVPKVGGLRASVNAGKTTPSKAESEELEAIKDKLAEKEAQVTELTERLETITTQTSTLESELDSLRQSADDSVTNLTQTQSQLSDALDRLTGFEASSSTQASEKAALEKSLEEAVSELLEARSLLTKNEAEISSIREKHASTIADLTSNHGMEKSQLSAANSADIAALKEDIVNLKSQITALHTDLKKAQEELSAKTTETENIQQQLQTVEKERLQLQKEFQAAGTSSDDYQKQIKAMEDQIASFHQMRTAHDVAIQHLQMQAEKAKAEGKDALEKALLASDQAKKANDDAVMALKAGHQAAIEDALRQAEAKHAQIVADQVDMARKEGMDRLDGLRKDLEESKIQEHEDLKEQMEQARKEAESSTSTSTAEIARLETALKSLEIKYAEEADAIKNEYGLKLEQAHTQAKDEASADHSSELARLNAQFKQSVDEIVEQHRSELAQRDATYKQELQSLQAQSSLDAGSIKVELEAALKDLSNAKSRNAELEKSLQAMSGQVAAAKEAALQQVKSGPSQDEEAVRKMEELAKTLFSAQNENKDLQGALQESQKSFSSMLQDLQNEQEQELTRKEQAFASSQEAAKAKIEQLQKEHEIILTKLRKELQEAQRQALPSPPSSPSRDEMVRLHHAHNSKVVDFEAKLSQLAEENAKLKSENASLKKGAATTGQEEEEFKYKS